VKDDISKSWASFWIMLCTEVYLVLVFALVVPVVDRVWERYTFEQQDCLKQYWLRCPYLTMTDPKWLFDTTRCQLQCLCWDAAWPALRYDLRPEGFKWLVEE
jgi:hypothetical protein